MYATLEAENSQVDKIRYEIVSRTEEKMRQACESTAEDEARRWAAVWSERENLSQFENGEESIQELLSKAQFLEALITDQKKKKIERQI